MRCNIFLVLYKDSGSLNEIYSPPPMTQAFEPLVPSWGCCLGKFGRCGLARESMSLRIDFKNVQPLPIFTFLSPLSDFVWDMAS